MPEQSRPVVTLDDQEGVRRIPVATLVGLWATIAIIREHHARWRAAGSDGK